MSPPPTRLSYGDTCAEKSTTSLKILAVFDISYNIFKIFKSLDFPLFFCLFFLQLNV